MKTKQKWISVKDLPEELQDERVLLAVRESWYGCRGEETTPCKHTGSVVSTGVISFISNEAVATTDSGDDYEETDILGWQPLDAPPGESK